MSNKEDSEVKADLTEVINNVYNDGISKPLQSVSSIISTTLDFVNNTILFPIQKYNLYARSKLDNYLSELGNKAQAIPTDNLTNPRVKILGPVVDELKYNLDEEQIKEMFTNILLSDMDNRKQNKVLPAYIEIVKQLNQNDAVLLKFIKNENFSQKPIIRLKINLSTGGYTLPSNDILLIDEEGDFQIISSIVIENLSRLKIIDIDFSKFLKNDSIYDKAFKKIKEDSPLRMLPDNNSSLGFSKGLLTITDFGKNFIDICLS